MREWGHVKISRKAYATDEWWKEPRVFSKWEAWEDCIQMAAWQHLERMTPHGLEPIQRGEFLASIRFLADRWGWSVQHTRTYLKLAQQAARITTQRSTRFGTVYRLTKYETYQGKESPANTAINTVTDTQINKQLGQQSTQIEAVSRKAVSKKKDSSLSPDEQAVVEHYRTRHPKRLRGELPEKTIRLIRQGLKGYSVEDLKQAIDGNAASQFHRENNHLGLNLILRDTEKIDYFIALAERPATNGRARADDLDPYERAARELEEEQHHAH